MSEQLSITSTLTVKTCTCGLIYAVPSWLEWQECPGCAARRIRELKEYRQDKLEENQHKDRVIASLRGALTRANRRRAR